jgi:hypothetical protein
MLASVFTVACGGNDSIGKGTVAELHLPNQLIFSQTRIGTSSTRTVEVKNSGNTPVEIKTARLSESDDDSHNELTRGGRWFSNGKLEPGDSKSVDIQFTPKTVEPIEGKLTFVTKGNGKKSVSIETPSLGPTLVSTQTVRFRDVSPGTSETRKLQIQNTGTASLKVDDILLQKGNNSDFEVSHPALPVDEVEPGDKVELEVVFAPEDQGQSKDDMLIWSNDPDRQRYQIDLSGGAEGPCLSTSLDSKLTFPETRVEQTSTKTATVTNCSESKELRISALEIDGQDADAFTVESNGLEPPGTISPGESIPLQIDFKPTAEKQFRAMLALESNDPVESRRQTTLEGRGFKEEDVTPGEDIPQNCGTGNMKLVDNRSDVRPNQSEDNCNIFIFPEKKQVMLDKKITVDVKTQRDQSDRPDRGGETIEPQRVNIYHGHYDRVGTDVWERSQGSFEFDNEILGIALYRDTLDKTNILLTGCTLMSGTKCTANDTIYPIGKENHGAFAVDYGSWNSPPDSGRDRVWITGERTIKAHLSTIGNTDNFRVFTKAN